MRDLSNSAALLLTAVVLACTGAAVANDALGIGHGCSHCRVEEVIEYRDVVVHRCKMVPAKKVTKKTVYEVKEVPFCIHKPTLPFGCDCCA